VLTFFTRQRSCAALGGMGLIASMVVVRRPEVPAGEATSGLARCSGAFTEMDCRNGRAHRRREGTEARCSSQAR